MKDKMVYVCNYEKNKEKSWSGVHNALKNSLSSYFGIEEFDIGKYNGSLFSYYCLFRRFVGKVFKIKDDFEMSILRHYRKYFKKNLPAKLICFSFSECPFQDNVDSYIYQNLSAGFIQDVKDNDPALFNICGFQYYSDKAIERRAKEQSLFHQKSKAIFTPSNWLRDYLIASGVDGSKVFYAGGGILIPH